MLPNILTLARLPLAAAFAVCVGLISGRPELSLGWGIALLAIAACAELTDLLDGYIARKTGTSSQLGAIFDPMVDSLARLIMYYAVALAGWITIAAPLVMTGRDIVVAYTRIVQALTGGKTSARISGKLKALVQGSGIFVIVAITVARAWLEPDVVQILRGVMAGLIILVTGWSLFDYLSGAFPGIRKMMRE